jgi:secreted trypsin-like serine protease
MGQVRYAVPGASTRTLCSGTIVSQNVILTAAHCVVDETTGELENPAWFSVVTGSPDVTSPSAASNAVSQVFTYPGYDPSVERGDAALLVLSKPIQEPTLRLAMTADAGSELGGTGAIIAGWGLTTAAAQSTPAMLQEASTVVQTSTYCQANSSANFPFDPTIELCALNPPTFDTGTCSGDSGGPLIASDASAKPVLIGVTSAGPANCSQTTRPDQFTRVSAISDWANSVIQQVAPAPAPAPAPPKPTPSPPALPDMTLSAARSYVKKELAIVFGPTFTRRADYTISCTRETATIMQCEVRFSSGASDYYGSVDVYYKLDVSRVYWHGAYKMHSVNDHCYFHSGHRSRCVVHTRSGT